MIVFHRHKLVYLHIPRTGGTSLSVACTRVVPGAVWVNSLPLYQHMPLNIVYQLFPTYSYFTVIRNPWRVFESFHGLCRRCVDHPEHRETWQDTRAFDDLKARVSLPFEKFVEQLVCEDRLGTQRLGGFTPVYIDPETTVFRYEDEPFTGIGKLLGVTLSMPRENASEPVSIDWTDRAIELVRQYMIVDVRAFQYEP